MQVETGSTDLARMLTRILIPRPVMLVTTINADGVVNAAPIGNVGIVAVRPPLVGICIASKEEGVEKDTLANIRATGELVLNLLTDQHVTAISTAAIAFPSGTPELAAAGLMSAPSRLVRPPRIVGSPGQLECRVWEIRDFTTAHGPGSSFVIAEILTADCDEAAWNEERPVG